MVISRYSVIKARHGSVQMIVLCVKVLFFLSFVTQQTLVTMSVQEIFIAIFKELV